MSDVKVFIMAAGDALRCRKKPKQLFSLPDGNTVVGRLIEQIENRGHNPVLVTHDEQIAATHDTVFVPEDRRTLCSSIFSTHLMWHNTNIFILGDVVFTSSGVDCATRVYGDTRVIGNEAEIYAMQFNEIDEDKVVHSLLKGTKHGLGKLRYFYKAYAGLPLEGPETEEDVMVWLRDETNDIDSIGEYQNMVARWSASANQPRH